jgi:hypothetical protein
MRWLLTPAPVGMLRAIRRLTWAEMSVQRHFDAPCRDRARLAAVLVARQPIDPPPSSSLVIEAGARRCWPGTSTWIKQQLCRTLMSWPSSGTASYTAAASGGSTCISWRPALVARLELWTTDPALATVANQLGIQLRIGWRAVGGENSLIATGLAPH